MKDICTECTKKLKEFNYVTYFKIKGNLKNIVKIHFCDDECFKEYFLKKFNNSEGK